jgi:hypothetical protein
MPPDKYNDIASLSSEEREGIDFRICIANRNSTIAIIAPHGGKIEAETSKIAAAIAGNTFNLYCFEGMKKTANKVLHITSHRFDEHRCRELVAKCDHVIAIRVLWNAFRIRRAALHDEEPWDARRMPAAAGIAPNCTAKRTQFAPNFRALSRRKTAQCLEICDAYAPKKGGGGYGFPIAQSLPKKGGDDEQTHVTIYSQRHRCGIRLRLASPRPHPGPGAVPDPLPR